MYFVPMRKIEPHGPLSARGGQWMKKLPDFIHHLRSFPGNEGDARSVDPLPAALKCWKHVIVP